jgi:hypothetical protein
MPLFQREAVLTLPNQLYPSLVTIRLTELVLDIDTMIRFADHTNIGL